MDIENYFQFIKSFRPELSIKTLRNYAKELDYFGDAYQIGFAPIELCEMLTDIALERLNLDHIIFENQGKEYEQNIRLSVFRNLINIFSNTITNKNYEILEDLIYEKRFKNQ